MFAAADFLFLPTELDAIATKTGAFAQKVMVVLLESDLQKARPFLEKMMGAAKLNLDQDALLIQFNTLQRANIAAEIKNKAPEQVLVFGIPPEMLCLNIEAKKYQPLFFLNTQWVFADNLATLEPDKNLKTALWTAMQVVFKLK